MVHLDVLVKIVVGVLIILTLIVNYCMQVEAYDEHTAEQNDKQFTLPFLLSPAYYHYFHSLLTASTNVPPQKHNPSWAQTWFIVVQCGCLTVTLFNWLANKSIRSY